MTIFEVIDSLSIPVAARALRISRFHVHKVRQGQKGLSLRVLAFAAGRYKQLDLRLALMELEPTAFAEGQLAACTTNDAELGVHKPHAEGECTAVAS